MGNPAAPARALVVLALTTLAAAQSACAPNGLTLTWGGTTRLGDAYSINLVGTPGVSGLLGADLVPGPVPTPVGLVCLGLSPALTTIPFTLDPAGGFSIGGVLPAHPSYYGIHAWLQAAAVDATVTGGLALSNGRHPVLRPPRLWIHTGSAMPPSMCVYDALTDTPSATLPLPGTFLDNTPVPVPELGWLVGLVNVPGSPPRLMGFDAAGATVLDHPFPANPLPPYPATAADLHVDGLTAYVMFGSTTGVSIIQAFSLPSATPGVAVVLPFTAGRMIANPGSGVVFVRSGLDVVPVDMANGFALSPITLGTAPGTFLLGDWRQNNGILYCLFSGTGFFGLITPFQINAIDMAALVPVLPTAVTLSGSGGSTLVWAVDAMGPAVFLTNHVNNQGKLHRIDAATLQHSIVANILNGSPALSAGGTEILVTGSNGAQRVDLATYVPSYFSLPYFGSGVNSVITSLPLPSTTLRKAYVVSSISATSPFNQIAWFDTDPATAPIGLQALPLSAQTLRVVVD